jgi:uncharacterized protein (TIGR02058 family)
VVLAARREDLKGQPTKRALNIFAPAFFDRKYSMAIKRVVTQFGMGTSIRSRNYTEAAARAIRDALWHNSLNVADAFGFPREAMIINVEIGVQRPNEVDADTLLTIFPYGQPSVKVVKGGLDIPRREQEGWSVIANAAIMVSFDMESGHD